MTTPAALAAQVETEHRIAVVCWRIASDGDLHHLEHDWAMSEVSHVEEIEHDGDWAIHGAGQGPNHWRQFVVHVTADDAHEWEREYNREQAA